LLACDEESAQYIQIGDMFYRAPWMVPVTTGVIPYTLVDVISIEESEYNTLKDAIDTGEEIVVEQPQEPEPQEIEVQEPDVTVEFVRSRKIAELSNMCNSVIENGFDVELSDGDTYHFSLTTQDQLNLITLSTMVASGETAIPYHADGELCKFYSATDVTTIINTATYFKTYHVSYFNALKAYVESMDDMTSIGNIEYGDEIPVEHQSDVLKVLLSQNSDS